MKKSDIQVRKNSGEIVAFDPDKLLRSLAKAGADQDTASDILNKVASSIVSGMSTKSIYKLAFRLLRKAGRHLAARYKLKQAFLELGPSGYPFEVFVAEIFRAEGYEVQAGLYMQGKCVSHEIDVLAEKGDQLLFMECKFHNSTNIVTDVKVPLYIHSRLLDLLAAGAEERKHGKAWVVTNTRFTTDAITYGQCVGLGLLSWDFPAEDSLRRRADRLGIHPISCITSMSMKEKQILLEQKIVTTQQLLRHTVALEKAGIQAGRISRILDECRMLATNINL